MADSRIALFFLALVYVEMVGSSPRSMGHTTWTSDEGGDDLRTEVSVGLSPRPGDLRHHRNTSDNTRGNYSVPSQLPRRTRVNYSPRAQLRSRNMKRVQNTLRRLQKMGRDMSGRKSIPGEGFPIGNQPGMGSNSIRRSPRNRSVLRSMGIRHSSLRRSQIGSMHRHHHHHHQADSANGRRNRRALKTTIPIPQELAELSTPELEKLLIKVFEAKQSHRNKVEFSGKVYDLNQLSAICCIIG